MRSRHSHHAHSGERVSGVQETRTNDLGPLFEQAPDPLDRLSVRLHHDIPTCQQEEARQQAVLKGRASLVLQLLRANGAMTRRELADAIGIEINCITAPVDALRREGFIVENGKRRGSGRLLEATPFGTAGEAVA